MSSSRRDIPDVEGTGNGNGSGLGADIPFLLLSLFPESKYPKRVTVAAQQQWISTHKSKEKIAFHLSLCFRQKNVFD